MNKFDLAPLSAALSAQQTHNDLLKVNTETEVYGLTLNEQQIAALMQTHTEVLQKTGRIEFGGGVTAQLIRRFCSSPYLSQQNYEEALHELIALFYEAKNATLDTVSDHQLIGFLRNAFDGVCRGSLELLSEWALPALARHIRSGQKFSSCRLEEEML